MRKVVANISFILKEVYAAKKSFIFISVMVYLIRLIEPLTSVLGIKWIIDILTQEKPFYYIGLILLGYGGLNIFKGIIDSWYREKYLPANTVQIEQYLSNKLMNKAILLDIKLFDDAKFYDKYTRAVNELNGRAISVVVTLCELLGYAFSIMTLTTIIIIIQPFLIVCVMIAVVLSIILDLIKSKIIYQYDKETTPFQRRLAYIKRIFYEPQYAKEMRIFKVSTLGLEKYRNNAEELTHLLTNQGKTKFLLSGMQCILEKSIFQVVALLVISYQVFVKAITIGDFSAMFTAVFQFGGELYSFLSRFPILYQHSLFIDNFMEVMQCDVSIEKGGELELDPNHAHSIEFKDVSFAYANGVQLLKHVNISIETGEKVAIVGYNGAGKSTLIKLMMRLYDPTEGSILVDGIDIREYSTQSLRRAFGVVLQDFQHYAFSIVENLYPEFNQDHNETKVKDAIQIAGLEKRIDQLTKGIYSSLTREFDEDGIVFSGGELQKLSFARAYASDAHILILDEVSSALDPVAENELNNVIINSPKNKDKTVVFISHRLTAAKMADKIYMIENGCVVEDGNHDELMNRQGKYAYLFNLQAQKYFENCKGIALQA